MRLQPYMCFAGTEIANGNRTYAYAPSEVQCFGWDLYDCTCDTLEDTGYTAIDTDPAPWYDGTQDSEDFLGVFAESITLDSTLRRGVTERGNGGADVGRLREKPRTITVSGLMFAKSDVGLWYGERWLEEVLAGSLCGDGCADDEMEILSTCSSGGFRRLYRVGIAVEPEFNELPGQHDFSAQRFGFQLVAGVPFLFTRPTSEFNAQAVASGATQTVLVEAAEWKAGASLVVEIIAGSSGATGLTLTGTVSLGGTCPEARTPSCFSISIPSLAMNSKLTIDARKKEVNWYNPMTLEWESGINLTEFTGPFQWPEVPPCTDLCLSLSNAGANSVTVTANSYGKER